MDCTAVMSLLSTKLKRRALNELLLPQRGSEVPVLAARTNHEREGGSVSFLRAHLAYLSRRVRRWRGEVDGKRVVVIHVFNAVFLGDVSGDCAFLHDECECGHFAVDVGGEKGCRGVKRLADSEEDAGHGVDHVKVGRCVEEACA